VYQILKQSQEVKELFSDTQMYKLKELHEEVDMFMAQFKAKHEAYVLKDDVEGVIPPRNKELIKKRTVWGMEERKVSYYKREVMRFESRVLQITQGKPVLSITNKLIHPITDVAYYMIRKNIGNQSRKISLSRLETRKKKIEKAFEGSLLKPDDMQQLLEEYELIKKAIDCIIANKKQDITLRTPVNSIRFYGYDTKKQIVTMPEGEHFRGGILISKNAQEVDVFSPFRKERINKTPEHEKLYVDGFSYFVCRGLQTL